MTNGCAQPTALSIPKSSRVLLRDATLVILATLLTAALCARFDISEILFHWTRRFEGLQFDELPVVLLVLAMGSMWFATQRYRESSAALAKQQFVDARLSAALADNRRLAQQYLSAQESERKNLARELHDELAQYLNAIKIDAISIRDFAAHDMEQDSNLDSEQCTDELRAIGVSISQNIDHVYGVTTKLIRDLRPVGLDDLGLSSAIEHCVEQWHQRLPNTRISISTEGDLTNLGEQASLTLYRLTQESLTNAAKHARAEHIRINLSRSVSAAGQTEISINITDDGIGTDLREPKSGFGLVGMRERVEMQGGTFIVRSVPQQGFSLSAHFPI